MLEFGFLVGGLVFFVFSVHWFDCYSPLILRNFNNCRASEHIANKERKKDKCMCSRTLFGMRGGLLNCFVFLF